MYLETKSASLLLFVHFLSLKKKVLSVTNVLVQNIFIVVMTNYVVGLKPHEFPALSPQT